jgi:nitrate reductase gamma subunit
MHLIPYIVAYLGLIVFFTAVIARFIMFAKLPMHLRWELYPVAHEGKKASYGGSYLEEFEWWSKPREKSAAGELKVMVPEIFFLVALKEHNRKMWTRSFPFHFGLYLIIFCTAFMVLASLLSAIWPSLAGGGLDTVLQYAAAVCGVCGMVLGIWGAGGLLGRRLTAPELKSFTSPADLFNLVFFIVAFGVAFLHFVTRDPNFLQVSSFVDNLVTFNLSSAAGDGGVSTLLAISVVLLSLLLAYIPLTHMSHFVGKYFAYHAVRWNDEPNLPGSKSEGKVGDLLSQNLTWSAPHIQGGKKTWGEAATENPAAEEEK